MMCDSCGNRSFIEVGTYKRYAKWTGKELQKDAALRTAPLYYICVKCGVAIEAKRQ